MRALTVLQERLRPKKGRLKKARVPTVPRANTVRLEVGLALVVPADSTLLSMLLHRLMCAILAPLDTMQVEWATQSAQYALPIPTQLPVTARSAHLVERTISR